MGSTEVGSQIGRSEVLVRRHEKGGRLAEKVFLHGHKQLWSLPTCFAFNKHPDPCTVCSLGSMSLNYFSLDGKAVIPLN